MTYTEARSLAVPNPSTSLLFAWKDSHPHNLAVFLVNALTMANTTTLLLCAAPLSSMSPKILHGIFWHSPELTLCLVSKRMYQVLPS